MSEKKHSDIKSYITELFSNQPASWTLVQKTMSTILQLAEAGNSIIIGRGGSIITANLKNTLHIRLVANLQDRVKRFKVYGKLANRIESLALSANLFHSKPHYWIHKCIKGFKPNLLAVAYIDYRNVSFDNSCLEKARK